MDITRILAPNPGPFTGTGTNSYVVAADGEAVIIDPGPLVESHLDAIRGAVAGLEVVGVMVTHHHLDHCPAANPLAGEFGVSSFGFGDYGGFQANRAVADGDGVPVGSGVIEVLHTPGHTPDSLCFSIPGGLFTGDTVKSGTTVVVEDMSDYMRTLDRLRRLTPGRIFPGHGEVIDDPAAVIADYIAHRQEREHQILTAVRRGARTLDEVVTAVYPDLDPALMPLATQSATAHFRKLVDEGRVGGDWAER